jgi:hypothetical protein
MKRRCVRTSVLSPRQRADIVARYKAGEASTSIGERYSFSYHSILRVLREEGVEIRVSRSVVRNAIVWKRPCKKNPYVSGYEWRDGKRVPIRQHRWVMEQHLGRKLTPGEEIHHIDENPANNAIENLMVVSRGEHQRLHH